MTEKSFIRADEVAEELDVSKSYAYKVIKQLKAAWNALTPFYTVEKLEESGDFTPDELEFLDDYLKCYQNRCANLYPDC